MAEIVLLTSWRCWGGIPIICKKGYADCMVTEGIGRLFSSPSAQHCCLTNLQRLPCSACTKHRQAADDGYHLVAWQTSCCCTVHVTKLHAVKGSSPSPYDLHLFSPLKKVLKGRRPQGHIGAIIPIATHCAVSGGDPPVGVLVGCPWGMFLTAPTLLRAIPKQVWHEQGLSFTCYGHQCCCVLFWLQVILKV